MKRVSGVFGYLVAVLVVGSGLAAVGYAANDPCLTYNTETSSVTRSYRLLPYGSDCQVHFSGPGTSEFIAWLAATALILGVAVWFRRSAAVRGAAMAVCVVGVLGIV